jgi:hypothetical protein
VETKGERELVEDRRQKYKDFSCMCQPEEKRKHTVQILDCLYNTREEVKVSPIIFKVCSLLVTLIMAGGGSSF